MSMQDPGAYPCPQCQQSTSVKQIYSPVKHTGQAYQDFSCATTKVFDSYGSVPGKSLLDFTAFLDLWEDFLKVLPGASIFLSAKKEIYSH